MACLAARESRAANRGLAWIIRARQADGGWPSRMGIPGSGWATALAALLPAEKLGGEVHAGAIRWLLRTQGEETSFIYRLRLRMLGETIQPDQKHPGWPWIPGASAWVGPTSAALFALRKEAKIHSTPQIQARIEEGRAFLLSRVCKEGGWNHGGANALGYPAEPYPETTGMGLLAMRGVSTPEVERALASGGRFLVEARTADAQNWLQLGLRAHGRLPEAYKVPEEIVYRTAPELALRILSEATARGESTELGLE
jgi:hypothetical protein